MMIHMIQQWVVLSNIKKSSMVWAPGLGFHAVKVTLVTVESIKTRVERGTN